MSATYKLTYFKICGLSEPIRYLFSYGGIDFEDIRISDEEWPNHKAGMPFCIMPILEFNGKVYHQSLAITRFLAKQVKLTGKNDLENLEIDGIVDTVRDLHLKIIPYYYNSDENVKKSIKETLVNETFPYYLQRFNDIVKKNNGYLAVERLTWADILFVASLDNMNGMMETDIIAKYPNLAELRKRIVNIPNIKAWIEKRPKSNR